MKYTLCVALLAVSAFAQNEAKTAYPVPQAEAFFGYSAIHFDTQGLPVNSFGLGWSLSGQYNPASFFGVKAQIDRESNTLVSGTSLKGHSSDFLAGPVLFHNYGRRHQGGVYVQVLPGWNNLTLDAGGISANERTFAAEAGAGIDYRFNRWIGIRTEGDYLYTHHQPGHQNNIRWGSGLLFTY
jgi:hypothetical protein